DRPVRVTVRFRVSRPTQAEIAAARREGRARPDWDPFWWHWIEYGTAERSTREGYARGRVTAKPFVWPVVDRAEPIAYRVIQDELDRAIDEVIAETRRPMRRRASRRRSERSSSITRRSATSLASASSAAGSRKSSLCWRSPPR